MKQEVHGVCPELYVIFATEESIVSSMSERDSNEKASSKVAGVRYAEKRRVSTCRFADRVAQCSVNKYQACVPESFRSTQKQTCLATVVAHDAASDDLFVIALGVGTKFLSYQVLQQELSEPVYGRRVRDCHAEVLARRAFRRYLSMEILAELQDHNKVIPNTGEFRLLERCKIRADKSNQSPSWKVRDGVTLHFYSSSAPCGNAVLKKFAKPEKEKFRDDLSDAEWPQEPHPSHQAHALREGQFALLLKLDRTSEFEVSEKPKCENGIDPRFRDWPVFQSTDWCPSGTTSVWHKGTSSLHTCSDKLARWNCLGWQGSLLSCWLQEPLYVSTMTVGRKLSGVCCRRAVCCRISDDVDAKDNPSSRMAKRQKKSENAFSVAAPYRLHHPSIMGTAVYMDADGTVETGSVPGQDVRFHSVLSWAWWPALLQAESIDSSTGLLPIEGTVANASSSQISTANLLDLHFSIASRLYDEGSLQSNVRPVTLQQLQGFKRQIAQNYECTKNHLLTNHHVLKQWSRRHV